MRSEGIVSKIAWSSYLQYEGPFWRGTERYLTPAAPSWNDLLLRTITATEGGRYDAYNGYDRCVCTSGLIQWCEGGQYSVSDMLGVVATRKLDALAELTPALTASRAEFRPNARGRWRFFFKDERGEVDRLQEQRELFLLRASGQRGSWDETSKQHAKLWAACISAVWTYDDAKRAQVDFTAPRLMGFVMPQAREILFGATTPKANEGWVGAVRAAYLSFAANLPAVANKHLQKALAATTAVAFSQDWCITILKQLTFGPQITIYPQRYNAIRPVLETSFGVNLPDFAAELSAWTATVLPPIPMPPGLTLADFDSVEEIQKELIAENYDIGPSGADGVMGPKTKQAVLLFQRLHGLVADGIVGPKTRQALLQAAITRLSQNR